MTFHRFPSFLGLILNNCNLKVGWDKNSGPPPAPALCPLWCDKERVHQKRWGLQCIQQRGIEEGLWRVQWRRARQPLERKARLCPFPPLLYAYRLHQELRVRQLNEHLQCDKGHKPDHVNLWIAHEKDRWTHPGRTSRRVEWVLPSGSTMALMGTTLERTAWVWPLMWTLKWLASGIYSANMKTIYLLDWPGYSSLVPSRLLSSVSTNRRFPPVVLFLLPSSLSLVFLIWIVGSKPPAVFLVSSLPITILHRYLFPRKWQKKPTPWCVFT